MLRFSNKYLGGFRLLRLLGDVRDGGERRGGDLPAWRADRDSEISDLAVLDIVHPSVDEDISRGLPVFRALDSGIAQ